MELTKLQLQHYDSFGYLLIRDFLSPDLVQQLRDTLTRLKTEESGEPDPLKHSGRVVGMFDTDPLHVKLFDDIHLHAIASQLLRSDNPVRFLGDEYASFSTPADWHPDMGPSTPFESLKFGFYLDDISRGGFLRVVPGSHHPEYSESVKAFRESQTPAPEIEDAHACMTQPGDLLIFNLKIWHQGTANPPGTHRRVMFWSVGQGTPEFDKYARSFHNKRGRGNPDEAWPKLMLKDAPPHRLTMLDIYEAGTVKQQAIAALR
jgi:ectoine hydroxylase-related dioxygenase (phytanoyl-CoA dioxygenase family)